MNAFLLAFGLFCAKHNPALPPDAVMSLGMVLYHHGKIEASCTLAGMCMMESSLKVRKYFPEVKQNKDYLGIHNNLFIQELKKQGFINPKDNWIYWKKRFQQSPEEGTAFGTKAFIRLVEKHGIDNAIMIWKTGKTNTVPGLEYLNSVKCLSKEMERLIDKSKGVRL